MSLDVVVIGIPDERIGDPCNIRSRVVLLTALGAGAVEFWVRGSIPLYIARQIVLLLSAATPQLTEAPF